MAESTKVWIKTKTLDKIVYGKSHSTAARSIPGAGGGASNDDNEGIVNWGWARATLVDNDGSSDNIEKSEVPVKVFIQDEESEHDRKTMEIPAAAVKNGELVMANLYNDEDEDDFGDGGGGGDDYYDDGGGVGGGGGAGGCYPDDLITLTHLHEPAVVYCLRRRYSYDKIYTATGPILLALNPFKNCKSLYSDSVMKKYFSKGEQTMLMSSSREDDDDGEEKKEEKGGVIGGEEEEYLPPHVYGIADHSFRTMMIRLDEGAGGGGGGGGGGGRGKKAAAGKGCDQSILVSGESGAGKTVTTKFIMQYLATLSKRSGGGGAGDSKLKKSRKGSSKGSSSDDKVNIEQQVLQSNPILESFGNARTIRNDNSSRFGKFIEIQFTKRGALVGAKIDTYLLEKVRLITQAEGERNYHVLYEILQGMTEEELDEYYLGDYTAEDFKMTNGSGTYDRRDGVEDCETYEDLLNAMDTMGFTSDEQRDIFTVTCAVLHLSNLNFNAISADESEIDRGNPHLESTLNLMGVTADALNRALCYFSIVAGKEKHVRSLSKEKAEKGIEALIKATYGALFTHIVQRINTSITVKDSSSGGGRSRPSRGMSKAATIGVLDIFGFESFKSNSFEQLCINYCNEALQQQFNLFVLKNEQEEYEREGIQWSFISFPDNQEVLDLIHKKGAGILNILDDQCRAPGTTDKTFANDIYQKCTSHPRFEANFRQVGALKFGVNHYAGPVEYTTAGFVEKNRDELPKEATELLKSSTNPFVKKLANIISGGGTDDAAGGGSKPATPSPGGPGARGAPRGRGGPRGGKSAGTRVTVGGQFAKQLAELRSKIDLTSPHYVRCLKPNDMLVPDHFDPVIVSDQLRCAGVVEAVRVSRVGYPQRYSHAMFVNRYRILGLKALKMAARGSRRVKPVEVLVNHIGLRIQEEENPTKAAEDKPAAPKGRRGAAGRGRAAPTAQPQVDLVSVGMQVGKTKVFLRRKAFDTLERYRNRFMRDAAIKIQTSGRKYICYREYQEDRRSIIAIQNLVRMQIAAEQVMEKRRNHNATIIQKYQRRMVAHNRYLSLLIIVSYLQKLQRGRLGRIRYENLNRIRKSVIIQKYYRCHYTHRSYRAKLHSSLVIQCAIRSYWARRVLKAHKAEAKNLQATASERDELKKETQQLRLQLERVQFMAKQQGKQGEDELKKKEEELIEMKKSMGEVDRLEKDLERVRSEFQEAVEKGEEHAKVAEEMEDKLDVVEKDLQEARTEKEALEAKVEDVTNMTDVMKKELDDANSKIQNLEKDLEEAKGASLAAAGAAASQVDSEEVEQLRQEIEELQEELEASREMANGGHVDDKIFDEIHQLNVQNDKLQKELDKAKKSLDSLDANSRPNRVGSSRSLGGVVINIDTDDPKEIITIEQLKRRLSEVEEHLDHQIKRANDAEASRSIAEDKARNATTVFNATTSVGSTSSTASSSEIANEVLTLQDEVQRLNRELADAKQMASNGGSSSTQNNNNNGNSSSTTPVDDDPNSAANLIRRYDELRRLAESGMEKDREIESLKREVEVLRDELEAGQTAASRSTDSVPNGGVVYAPTSSRTSIIPEEEGENGGPAGVEGDLEFGNKDFGTLDEMQALRDVNEMLRKELEMTRRDAEHSKKKLKEETERSARELEAFADTLRGVDELRKAAETMSREINKTKRRDRVRSAAVDDEELTAYEAAENVRRATQMMDSSRHSVHHETGDDLWTKVRSTLGGGGSSSKTGQDALRRQMQNNVGELPSRTKRNRKKRRDSNDNKSIVSSYF